MVEEIIYWILTALVFPGLLFIVALGLFTQYWMRKLSARMQNRMGPAYVGPIGLLQPLMDLWKLIRVKEEVVTRYSMPGLAKTAGLIALAAAVSVLALFPLSPLRITGPYDYLVYAYMFSLMLPVMLIVMSLSMPGPYTSVGVSRLLTFITVVEPTYFAALLVPVALASKYGDPYSVYTAATNSWRLWLNPFTIPLMILALMASITVLQAKAMYAPFNIPEAEQEIIAGFETEFSGPILGLANLVHDVEIAVTALSITYLLLGGPYPYSHLSIPGIILLIIKFLAVITVATIIKNTYGRYRIEQALTTMTKYGLIPGIIAVILTYIYLIY